MKFEKIVKWGMIPVIFILLFVTFGDAIYTDFFSGYSNEISGTITDAWFRDESINVGGVEHWWITIQIESNEIVYTDLDGNVFYDMPMCYWFTDEDKVKSSWYDVKQLIGEDVVLKYNIISRTNQLTYFKSIRVDR